MAIKLGLKMDENTCVLAAHLGLSERKCQSTFDEKKTVGRWNNNIKMAPKETEWQNSCGLRWRPVANSYKHCNKVYGSIQGGEHADQLNGYKFLEKVTVLLTELQ